MHTKNRGEFVASSREMRGPCSFIVMASPSQLALSVRFARSEQSNSARASSSSRCDANCDKVTRVNSERRATLLWVAIALLVFIGAYAWKKTRPAPDVARPDWQRSVSELTESQQRIYRELRVGLRAAETERARTKTWPELDLTPNVKWSRLQQRLAINYVAEAEGLRWLVLFLEPDPRATEAPPPDDDEHHTLSDGTSLHVTVWTQPLTTPRTDVVTAFPAAEGWVERVAR